MIHLDRKSVPVPRVFSSEKLEAEKIEAAAFFSLAVTRRRQRQFDWARIDRLLDFARPELLKVGNGKCAYCERVIANERGQVQMNMSRFRPRGGALDASGELSVRHYWWLAAEWKNLLPSCASCSFAKSNRFPVGAARSPIGAKGSALTAEKPLLLDPCADRPERHLVFDSSGRLSHLSDRGRVTIEVLALNRAELLEARREFALQLGATLDEFFSSFPEKSLQLGEWTGKVISAGSVVSHFLPEAPFQGLARQLLQQRIKAFPVSKDFVDTVWRTVTGRRPPAWLLQLMRAAAPTATKIAQSFTEEADRQRAKESHSVEADTKTAREFYFSGSRRVERVEIRNFKSIRELSFTPPHPTGQESWLMFLGENATGKSSLLQAVALALLGQDAINRLALDARRFVTYHEKSGSVRVYLTNMSVPIELTFGRQDRRFSVTPAEPMVLVLGYGATRLLPRSPNTRALKSRYVLCRNLFNPYAQLMDAERWLTNHQRVPDKRFDEAAVALKRLLLLEDESVVYRHRHRVLIRQHGHDSHLADLSDGYQSVVALAVNIMMSVVDRWPTVSAAEGLVLLDEIETHLHPRWKMQIVERLRAVFPRLLFLCTTHDPLCLRGLHAGEIMVLRAAGPNVTAEVVTESVDHLRADQLLTSPLFGLPHTRGRATEDSISRYTELLGKAKRTAKEEAEMKQLGDTLGSQIQAGETPSQRRLEAAVSSALDDMSSSDSWPIMAANPTLPDSAREKIRNKLAAMAAAPS